MILHCVCNHTNPISEEDSNNRLPSAADSKDNSHWDCNRADNNMSQIISRGVNQKGVSDVFGEMDI